MPYTKGTFNRLHPLRWLASLLLIMPLLAGCDHASDGQLPRVNGEAIAVTQEEAIEGFALVDAWPSTRYGTLTLAVQFSQPLLGTQDFDALLRFEENLGNANSSWSLAEDGQTLHYPYIQANQRYTLIISPELTAADDTRLGQKIRRQVYTGALEPAVGFASQGSVLPARESRGLPVVAVNVPEIDVEFLRVRESALALFFSEYQRAGRRSTWNLDNNYYDTALTKLAEPVYLNRFVLDGEANQRTLSYLPVQDIRELQQPGLYFAVMKRTGSFQSAFDTTFFTVSDLGLHTRAYKEHLFVHTASLATGAAAKQVELRILDAKGRTIHRGQTDAHGNALLEYKLNAGHVLVAQSGNDVTLLPFNQPALDLSEFAVSGRQQAWFDVFAWSGRDLYRPGETVRVSALMRDHDGMPVGAQPIFVRLKQPDGKPLRETRLDPDAQGYLQFEQRIPEDAATGRWQLEFRTDPASKEAVQGMRLRIEEFLPERMKLDLSSPQATLKPGEPLKLQADAAYLYGAPASGNRFTARLNVLVDQHPVDTMPGWFFGDPLLELPREPQEVINTQFPTDGILTQDITLPEETSKGSPIAVVVAGSVYESGGRTVTRTLKRVLWPAPALVALRPLFDDEDGAPANGRARFELRRVNAEGQMQPTTGLQVTLVREHRDYHWNYANGRWDYDFIRRFENQETRTLDVGDASATFDFPVKWGEYRIEVLDPATGLTTRYPFRAGWSWNDDNRGLDARPDKVKLALDKPAYRAGDTLTVTITPPHPGKGLLLVETDRLLHTQEIDVQPGSTFSIPVSQDWERHDVYITALVFRGGSAPSKITPARAVGVVHVPMDRSERTVEVSLTAPAQMRSEQPIHVTVNAPALAGKPAHVVVSAVDVGILNITRFPVPDAAAHFFAKRRLGTDAYDIYGRVIESFEGSRARLKFGGDMALVTLPQARRPTAKVQTTDLFSGPVALDADGKANIELMVPDFNGTLRVSALVYAEGNYGTSDTQTIVRAPVLAEASLPRVLAPGDTSTLTLDVQNFTDQAGTFQVHVEGEGPLEVGQSSRQIQLEKDAKTTLNFPLTAREGHTVAKVRIRVDGNNIHVDRRVDLPIRAAWPQVLRSQTYTLDPLAAISLERHLLDGLMADSAQVRLMVSPVPPIPFAAALEGALDYPYGCAEQTTSKGYAALILDDATTALLGLGARISPDQRRARMEGTLARLSAMQVASGHFSMWGNQYDVNPALTPYIAEFLMDAREAGFAVPEDMLQKALERISADLLAGDNAFYGNDHREALQFSHQAYSGYVLARLKRAPLGTLRTLYDHQRAHAINGLPLVHLGLALTMQGDTQRGQAAISAGFDAEDKRPNWLGDYGSRLRDAALMIALVHERGQAKPEYAARAVAIGRELDARARANAHGILWLSTQEQIALARLGKALMLDSEHTFSGELIIGHARQDIAARKLYTRLFDAAQLNEGVRLLPQGTPPLYVSVDTAGIPRQPPAADARMLGIVRDWFNLDGTPWTPGPLKEGQALIARLKVTAQQDMADALITDLLPAGLEIENFNLTDPDQWKGVKIEGIDLNDRRSHNTASNLRHEEFRDDRYVAAVKLRAGRTMPLFYLVRAVTPGTYHVPPPLGEDMYRPELRGVGRALPATITVVQP